MQYRPMEITIISAKDLKRVKHLSKMDVYVLVSLSGGPQIEQKTPVDKGSGPNPTWNFPMNFNIDEEDAKKDRLILNFKVMCHRRIHSDKEIGEANVPVKELLDNGGDGKFVKYVTYQLKKPNGKHRGQLNLSYKFANQALETSSSVKVNEPAAAPAYPPPGYPPVGVPPMGYAAPPFNGGFNPQQQAFGPGFSPTVVRPQNTSDNTEEEAYLSGVLEGFMLAQILANGGAGGNVNLENLFGAGFTTTDQEEVSGAACDAGPQVAGTGGIDY
ncbi:16 kDa phloem protein 2 [Morus notabilis]|uniref:16 kDa phloem protein 2 n=1 Tax=Morus notabilis TaxID=981085 RepID=W9QLW2_9ROSA|nr:protein SRC2 [Morus notabilis]EXB40827.1 16 kDa phloem protein 2 [Morus notabilis]